MAELENSKDLISVLWSGADILRSKMDANEYKDYLLGIVFYKYLSDSFLIKVYDLIYDEKPENLKVALEAYKEALEDSSAEELKEQINDLYSTLLRTIDDLDFKNKEILKLEKLKYDFFKGSSHELKTPLASLKIILENMKYNIGKYKDRDFYINDCIDIVDSLTKNISQIISVYSIESLKNDE